MSELERRLAEDRALRDAALRLFKSDLGLVRGGLREKGAGARVAARLGEATMETLDDAVDYAQANKGKVAALAAAAVLWFARGPIIDALARLFAAADDDAEDDDDAEPDEPGNRSGKD